ncbi:MAG: acyltransferase [Arcanobacterium sp.]|nr:acyltransferase [Arcanobacterium sp.]MDY5589236.1 acyltransferase [Arcanobacterium sp.]
MQPPQQPLRHLYFADLLNVFACIAVVLLHTSLSVFSPRHTLGWLENVGIQATFIFAVPIFFMLSGMNLLGYRAKYSTAVFFKKRFVRTGRALILGSITSYLIIGALRGTRYTEHFGLVDFVKRFLTNQVVDIYWFFYVILYLYLLTPLLSHVAHQRRLLEYLIVLTGIASVGVPFLVHMNIPNKYFAQLIGWPFFASIALLYFLLGWYAKQYAAHLAQHRWRWLAAFLAAVAGMLIGELLDNGWFSGGQMPRQYDNYWAGISSPLCVLAVLSLFMLCLGCEPQLRTAPHRLHQVLAKLSSASLGIYLFHILLVNFHGSGTPLKPVLEQLSRFPITKGIIAYVLTGIAVVIGKEIIAHSKRLVNRHREQR